jgi:hypothetical protein
MEATPSLDPIIELLITYNELNCSSIEELSEAPSALEFMRFVKQNRPFVIRGGASDWEATTTWNVSVLKDLLKGQSVNVAVTPKGYVIFHPASTEAEPSKKCRFSNSGRGRRSLVRETMGRTRAF